MGQVINLTCQLNLLEIKSVSRSQDLLLKMRETRKEEERIRSKRTKISEIQKENTNRK